jgi:hypothetical protein
LYDRAYAASKRNALCERPGKQFYGDMPGFKPTNQEWTDVWASFDAGDFQIALHAIPADIARHIQISSPPASTQERSCDPKQTETK